MIRALIVLGAMCALARGGQSQTRACQQSEYFGPGVGETVTLEPNTMVLGVVWSSTMTGGYGHGSREYYFKGRTGERTYEFELRNEVNYSPDLGNNTNERSTFTVYLDGAESHVKIGPVEGLMRANGANSLFTPIDIPEAVNRKSCE
jgi:hypothetical protein